MVNLFKVFFLIYESLSILILDFRFVCLLLEVLLLCSIKLFNIFDLFKFLEFFNFFDSLDSFSIFESLDFKLEDFDSLVFDLLISFDLDLLDLFVRLLLLVLINLLVFLVFELLLDNFSLLFDSFVFFEFLDLALLLIYFFI